MMFGLGGTLVEVLKDVSFRLAAMACNHPEISELDINPPIVHANGQGSSVADSRIVLKQPE